MNKIFGFFLFLFVLEVLQAIPAPRRKGFGPGDQEYGYFDVRQGAHMFYWLFYVQDPSVSSYYSKPLVIWLQGGPGASSTGFGNFEEIGPIFINKTKRPSSWANQVNLLFIDNPVGAGFSYVDKVDYLARNNSQIGRDMISFLKQFYKQFSKFEKTPLYIFSESYGGKMTVEIAKQLVEANKTGELTVNFQGIALGDSWISPVDSTSTWGPFLYYTGMIDRHGLQIITDGANKIKKAADSGKWSAAFGGFGELSATVGDQAGGVDFYNIFYKGPEPFSRSRNKPLDSTLLRSKESNLKDLMNGPVKKALGIPSNVMFGGQSNLCFYALGEDFMKPVVDVVEHLLNNTNLKVVVYTANMDLIVDTPGTIAWIEKLKWKGAEKWATAPRYAVSLNHLREGFSKTLDNLSVYWVHASGHMVPYDNPEMAMEILRQVTKFDES